MLPPSNFSAPQYHVAGADELTVPAAISPARWHSRSVAIALALALVLARVNRACGDENDLGYRKSFYREDNGRINVNTDTWQYNVGVQDNVRLSGNVVMDAISGATPNGAPPQTQWNFPTQSSLYQSAYQSAFTSQYNQFVANNQIYVDSGLETYAQLTNDASAFATQTAPNIATNSAAASYNSLTNNPDYRRGKVPLTHMHDRRTAFSIQLPVTFGENQITPSFAYSEESDYISFGGALNYSRYLNDKNTTLSTGWSHNADTVRDDLMMWQSKMTDDIFLGLVQLCGPKAYFTVNASLGFSHGYLADPYRGVMFANVLQNNPSDPALSPEVRPRHRNNQILYASWTQFLTPVDASYEISYRYFHDSYGINANTVQLDWHQKIGKHLVISPTARYYLQNAADFYYVIVPDSNNPPTFYSSDYRLSKMETFTVGVTVSWRVIKHLSLDASYLRYVMRGLDGVTSQSAYPSANVISLGGRIWF